MIEEQDWTQKTFWERTAAPFSALHLDQNLNTEVIIVGAGIAGLMTAYALVREGLKVVVLDAGPVGGRMTGRTTAHLTAALDDRYQEIETFHGAEGARLAAQSHRAAVDQYEKIVAEEGIECDFERVDGFLFLPPLGSPQTLIRELAAVHRAGLADVEWVDRVPLGNWESGPALRFPAQAQVHPLRFVRGLAAAIIRRGGQIFTGTKVVQVEGGSPAKVRTLSGHEITAVAVVVATNSPINDRYVIHTKQAPYQTYVVGLSILWGALPPILLWDTSQGVDEEKKTLGPNPYHYVRLARHGAEDILLVGGEDHKTGQADDSESRFARLELWARERFVNLGPLTDRWSGQVLEPIDLLAFIGRNPSDAPNVFVATGDSGNGMTHGAIAGMLLRDLIVGKANPWTTLYEPSRKIVHSRLLADFAKENLNVAAHLGDYLSRGEVDSVEQVARGTGALLRDGLTKRAVYRDDAGFLHQFSAVCPHLKCIVHWNGADRTWDCPCHGSRFNCLGQVIDGPATSNLQPKLEPLPV